jgi:hypothetical protein
MDAAGHSQQEAQLKEGESRMALLAPLAPLSAGLGVAGAGLSAIGSISGVIRIVEAESRHVGMIAAQLTEEDRAAFVGLGCDPRRIIRGFFRQSGYRRAALIDERPVAIWGITGPWLASTGILWLRLAPRLRKLPRLVVEEGRLELMRMLDMRQELTCYIHWDNRRAQRFAEFFGFALAAPAQLDGVEFIARKGVLRRPEQWLISA